MSWPLLIKQLNAYSIRTYDYCILPCTLPLQHGIYKCINVPVPSTDKTNYLQVFPLTTHDKNIIDKQTVCLKNNHGCAVFTSSSNKGRDPVEESKLYPAKVDSNGNNLLFNPNIRSTSMSLEADTSDEEEETQVNEYIPDLTEAEPPSEPTVRPSQRVTKRPDYYGICIGCTPLAYTIGYSYF